MNSLIGFWTVLLENDVSHKALLAFLAHLIPMDHNVKVRHDVVLSQCWPTDSKDKGRGGVGLCAVIDHGA